MIVLHGFPKNLIIMKQNNNDTSYILTTISKEELENRRIKCYKQIL